MCGIADIVVGPYSFDVAFQSGREPSHPSRADFLTRSKLSSKRGYRALVQGRLPLDQVATGSAWHQDIRPFLRSVDPDTSFETPQGMAESLRAYDLLESDDRSSHSYRRENEAREQLTVDLALSSDIYSSKPFSPASKSSSPSRDLDDALETMSRATEAMSLSDSDLPPVRFGFLAPVPEAPETQTQTPEGQSQKVVMPLGVRLLLKEWDVGTDPETYSYHDPYGPQKPPPLPSMQSGRGRLYPMAPPAVAPSRTIEDQSQTQTKRPPMVVPAVSPAVASRPLNVPPPPSRPTLPVYGSGARSQDAMVMPSSQMPRDVVREVEESSQVMPSTQIVPGPFGGRPSATGKKKAVKKRLGGF